MSDDADVAMDDGAPVAGVPGAAAAAAVPRFVAGGADAVEYCRKVVAASNSEPDAALDAATKKEAASARQEKVCARVRECCANVALV